MISWSLTHFWIIEYHIVTAAHKTALKKIPVIPPKHGLKLRALLSFESGEEKRIAGDEWQLEGPLTYYPRPEVVSHFVLLF